MLCPACGLGLAACLEQLGAAGLFFRPSVASGGYTLQKRGEVFRLGNFTAEDVAIAHAMHICEKQAPGACPACGLKLGRVVLQLGQQAGLKVTRTQRGSYTISGTLPSGAPWSCSGYTAEDLGRFHAEQVCDAGSSWRKAKGQGYVRA